MARAVSPVVGVALLAFVTVTLSLAVVTAAPALSADPPPTTQLSVSVDAGADRIAIKHRAGSPLDVAELTVTVEIDGTQLQQQPPVPFFAARGFESGPTGPFNTASPDTWRAGQTASFRIATTNHPQIEPGATVSVTVATEQTVIRQVSVRAA